MANDLITASFPIAPLKAIIRMELKNRLEPYAAEMRANAGKGTSPSSPGWWSGNVQSYIQVEDLGGGSGLIMFGLGLIEGTPEQALWQAYIFNFGSGQYGKNGMITSQAWFYNVNTGSMESGSAPSQRVYPQFGKQKNRWFDDVADKLNSSTLSAMMQEVVKSAVAELFSSGVWKLKGHQVSVKL